MNVLGPTRVADTETLGPPSPPSSCCRLFCFLFMTLEKQRQGPNMGTGFERCRVWVVADAVGGLPSPSHPEHFRAHQLPPCQHQGFFA